MLDEILSCIADKMVEHENRLNSSSGNGIWKRVWKNYAFMIEGQSVSWTETNWKKLRLIFSVYTNEPKEWGWQIHEIPYEFVNEHEGVGMNFLLTSSKFSRLATKYLYIYKKEIKGHAENNQSGKDNGISYNNKLFVLREVWLEV